MFKNKNNSVSFINNEKYSDSIGYDLSTSSATECDTQTLLDGTQEKSDTYRVIHMFRADIIKNHFKLFIVICDIFCILVFTLFLLTVNALKCNNSSDKEILEWCKPFEPVDKIIVDLNFDLLVHCDMPKSCAAYAEILMEKKGYNYNFIIGDEDLVYVGKGFQCKSDVLRLQMLITRYTWDPKKPVYKIPEEVVVRYTEIIYEGLQCGKISTNFTVNATCSVYGDWCGEASIKDHIPWTRPGAMAYAHEFRYPWYEQPHEDKHPFFAFDVVRVYDRYHRLKVCNHT